MTITSVSPSPSSFKKTSADVDLPRLEDATLWSSLGEARWLGLDLLRGAAGILVFLFHYAGMTAGRTSSNPTWEALESASFLFGSIGTNLLLLLCGLLIGKSVAQRDFSYPDFLRKRSIRLYFLYLSVLLLAYAFTAVFPVFSKSHPHQNEFKYFFSQLLLLPGLFPDRPMLTVSWTLSYIFAGYCILPLLAVTGKKYFSARLGNLGVWIACLIACLTLFFVFGSPSIRLSYIPAGCILAELLRQDRVRLRNLRHLWSVFAIGFSALLCRFAIELNLLDSILPVSFKPLFFFVCGLTTVSSFTLFAIFSSTSLQLSGVSLIGRLLSFTGKRGYSFYLLHGAVTKVIIFFAILLVPEVFNWYLTDLLLLLFCFASALFISHLSYHLLEGTGTGACLALFQRPVAPPQNSQSFTRSLLHLSQECRQDSDHAPALAPTAASQRKTGA